MRIFYFDFFDINHATSSNLNLSYYPHRSREFVSPVCGIFLVGAVTCLLGEVKDLLYGIFPLFKSSYPS